MATVTVFQPTDMLNLSNYYATQRIPTSTEVDYVNPPDFQILALKSGASVGQVQVDTTDTGYFPNVVITNLQVPPAVFDSFFVYDGTVYNMSFTALFAFLLSGDDLLLGSPGNDTLAGFGGSDTVSYSNASAGLFAGIEDWVFNTGEAAGDTYNSIENLVGSPFNDILYGSAAVNTLSGGAGDDVMVGKAGGDTFDGGPGRDTVSYDADFDPLRADLLLTGTNTGDAAGDHYISIENLAGSTFDDVLLGDNAANVISGNAYPKLASGADRLFGRGGNDILNGNDGGDRLDGGPGNDLLVGGAGNDKLIGGTGIDRLIGGAGDDFFVFNAPLSILNRDVIVDFANAVGNNDTIQLNDAVFTKLGVGGTRPLNPAFFHAGPAAADANDHIIYDKATGALFYDINGNVAGGVIQIATLINHPVLTPADFQVI